MLNESSPLWLHTVQNVSLIFLSLIFLPLDTVVVVLVTVWSRLRPSQNNQTPSSRPRTILVTGVGMTKGLVLARLFTAAGHRVIGADFSWLACGRISNSLKPFYTLERTQTEDFAELYAQSLLSVVRKESVDLWVSCSGVASAIEDGFAKEIVERSTSCKAVQFNVETTERFHEKSSFINYIASLGLTVPETHTVTSIDEVEDLLSKSMYNKRKYICKGLGLNDASRGDMTLLPLESPSKTSAHLQRLNVSKNNPWIIQQFIKGKEYCTHALVIRGQVRAFVACQSSELLMHYVALPGKSKLSDLMLAFTQKVAARNGQEFTGHLSFDFLIEDDVNAMSEITLYPIECNPRAHTAVALFQKTVQLADAYLELLDEPVEILSAESKVPIYPTSPQTYYWIGHDLVCRIILPTLAVIRQPKLNDDWIRGLQEFMNLLHFWKDGTFEVDDPLPWWWLYHVYWPAQFFICLIKGQRWSRINISTTKMFMCD